MRSDEERAERLFDERLRRRVHAADDDLRLAYSGRVPGGATIASGRPAVWRLPRILAVTLAAAATVVFILGSHVASRSAGGTPSAPPSLNGGASPPAPPDNTPRLLSDAISNLNGAASYHLVASALACNAGSPSHVVPRRVDADVTILRNGDVVGTASIHGAPGATFEVTRTGGHLYLRGSALWRSVDPASVSRYGDHWVEVSAALNGIEGSGRYAGTPLGSVACSLDRIPGVVTRFAAETRQYVRIGDTTYQGQAAIEVRARDETGGAPRSIVLVGPPALPAVLAGSQALRGTQDGERADSLTFDRVGVLVPVSAPVDVVPVA